MFFCCCSCFHFTCQNTCIVVLFYSANLQSLHWFHRLWFTRRSLTLRWSAQRRATRPLQISWSSKKSNPWWMKLMQWWNKKAIQKVDRVPRITRFELFLFNKITGDTSKHTLILIDSALLLCLQGWWRVWHHAHEYEHWRWWWFRARGWITGKYKSEWPQGFCECSQFIVYVGGANFVIVMLVLLLSHMIIIIIISLLL